MELEQLARVDPCSPASLPEGIRQQLDKDFASWRIERESDLGRKAHAIWKHEDPAACPGIATGRFRNAAETSVAVLLVPKAQRRGAYKLLMFDPRGSSASFQCSVFEESSDPTSASLYIHTEMVEKFFDKRSKKRFQPAAPEILLLVDAGKNEYEANIYFWADGRYKKEWVDY